MRGICLIYNFAQHYRLGVFSLLESELNVDFYFGDKMAGVKKLDYSLLSNFKGELKNSVIFSPIYWQKGALSIFFKNYSKYEDYIVLGEYYCLSTWLLLFLVRFSKGKRIIFWSHGWYGNEGILKRIIKKFFFNLSDGVFLYGDYARSLMIDIGIPANKLHVIYNSLNYKFQKEVRKSNLYSEIFSSYFNNSNDVLIFTGRLTSEKRLDYLVKAVSILESRGKSFNLVFVGSGEIQHELENLLFSLGLENFWFYGACYDEKILAELFYNSSLCISPGNVGLTAIHSLTYGTPVITHSDFRYQGPEFEAIVPGVSGDFFIKDDCVDLASKIEVWFSLGYSREKIRENCFSIIEEKYNPDYQLSVIKSTLSL